MSNHRMNELNSRISLLEAAFQELIEQLNDFRLGFAVAIDRKDRVESAAVWDPDTGEVFSVADFLERRKTDQ